MFKNTVLLFLLVCFSCGSSVNETTTEEKTVLDQMIDAGSDIKEDAERDKKRKEKRQQETDEIIVLGIEQPELYLPKIEGKTVGVVANPTSVGKFAYTTSTNETKVETKHLVDFLVEKDIKIKTVFAPEHGFRGTADAGELIKDGVDTKTGLPIASLHGKNKKPTPQQMQGIDVMVFDIQDVGVRFYTYISTLHYVMEACAEANIPFLILDRPNPNGHYVDGPTMEKQHTSFLGMHPIPLVHGMTIGEYAQMINGEGWLTNNLQADIEIIKLKNYNHDKAYSLPVRPSPNLPNDVSINLYPSLGLLEGTNLNAGRGTEMQFQIFGSPFLPKEKYAFEYTPKPNFGSKNPKHNGEICHGLDLRNTNRMDQVDLTWIIEAYNNHSKEKPFFNTKNFTAHAGTEKLQQQIEQGYTFREIRKTWLNDLEIFKKKREKYLLYD